MGKIEVVTVQYLCIEGEPFDLRCTGTYCITVICMDFLTEFGL